MRALWPKSRRDKGDSKKAAEAALASASTDLQNIRDQSTEVKKLVTDLRELRERNHFGEALERMILYPKGPHYDAGR